MSLSTIEISCPHCRRTYRVKIDLERLMRVRTRATCSRCKKSFDVASRLGSTPHRAVVDEGATEAKKSKAAQRKKQLKLRSKSASAPPDSATDAAAAAAAVPAAPPPPMAAAKAKADPIEDLTPDEVRGLLDSLPPDPGPASSPGAGTPDELSEIEAAAAEIEQAMAAADEAGREEPSEALRLEETAHGDGDETPGAEPAEAKTSAEPETPGIAVEGTEAGAAKDAKGSEPPPAEADAQATDAEATEVAKGSEPPPAEAKTEKEASTPPPKPEASAADAAGAEPAPDEGAEVAEPAAAEDAEESADVQATEASAGDDGRASAPPPAAETTASEPPPGSIPPEAAVRVETAPPPKPKTWLDLADPGLRELPIVQTEGVEALDWLLSEASMGGPPG